MPADQALPASLGHRLVHRLAHRLGRKLGLSGEMRAEAGDMLDATRGIETRLGSLEARLGAIEAHLGATEAHLRATAARLAALEEFSHGSRATYMGSGLVLLKAVVHGRTIAYLVEADDRLIAPWFIASGQYETELTDFFATTLRHDDHCLDVGANFGYFTCLFARFCPQGRIVGIEADERLFNILRDNIHINGFGGHATAWQNAACESERMVQLHRRIGRSGNTSITRLPDEFIASLGEQPSEAFLVAGVTVDAAVTHWNGRLDVMKVDVEGAEPLVCQGAAAAIAANPQLQIVMEWSPGQIVAAGFDIGEFLDALAAMGMGFHGLGPGRPVIGRDALLGMDYAAGILITKQPR